MGLTRKSRRPFAPDAAPPKRKGSCPPFPAAGTRGSSPGCLLVGVGPEVGDSPEDEMQPAGCGKKESQVKAWLSFFRDLLGLKSEGSLPSHHFFLQRGFVLEQFIQAVFEDFIDQVFGIFRLVPGALGFLSAPLDHLAKPGAIFD